jgi:hypothetical protein
MPAPPTLAPAPPATAPGTPSAPPAVAPKPGAKQDPKEMCAALVPEKYRGPDLQTQAMLPGTLLCTYSEGGGMKSTVSLDCRRGRGETAWKREFADKANELGATIGRATAGSKQSADFLDGQVDCIVGVALFGENPDVTELAREVEAKVTPENAPGPPARAAGDPDLACDKLVTDEIKRKHGIGALEKEELNLEKTLNCQYKLAGDDMAFVSANYDCRIHWGSGDMMKQFAEQMGKQGKSARQEQIGAGAVVWEDGAMVADGDTKCNISVGATSLEKGGKVPDAAALATDLEKALTPSAIGL